MELVEKRFLELARRADEKYYTTFSEFLNAGEEAMLLNLKLDTPFKLFGGYEGAERCVAAFGYNCDEAQFPISVIKIEPVAQKFADKLSHRDFLGTLMGLGIKREVLGDILIKENVGYLFCLNSIAEYIVQNISKIRHTTVKCAVIDEVPASIQSSAVETEKIVASERLDVLVAAVYNFSRNTVKEYFTERKVFVNSVLCENFSFVPKEGDIISVRGKGRFVFNGVLGKTKKGRLVANLSVYK